MTDAEKIVALRSALQALVNFAMDESHDDEEVYCQREAELIENAIHAIEASEEGV